MKKFSPKEQALLTHKEFRPQRGNKTKQNQLSCYSCQITLPTNEKQILNQIWLMLRRSILNQYYTVHVFSANNCGSKYNGILINFLYN